MVKGATTVDIEYRRTTIRLSGMARRSATTETAPITAILVAACLAAYVLERAGDGDAICAAYGLVPAHPTVGTAISAMFLHASYAHIGGNMVFLAVLGTIVERALGSVRFAILYLAAGIAGAGLHLLVAAGSTTPMVGASGAICGVLAAAALLRPRLLGFVAAFIAWNIWEVFTNTGAVAVGAHIGGFAMGFLVVLTAKGRDKVKGS